MTKRGKDETEIKDEEKGLNFMAELSRWGSAQNVLNNNFLRLIDSNTIVQN